MKQAPATRPARNGSLVAGPEDTVPASGPATTRAPRLGALMTSIDRDQLVQSLVAHGNRAILEEDWTPQLALDVLRENRRRHASEPRTQALEQLSAQLADDLAAKTGVAPADIALVLLVASSTLAGPALIHRFPGVLLTDLLGYTADNLDQRASGGES